MNQSVPVRPGSRIAAADSVIYEHPPLVEAWLSVEFAAPLPVDAAARLRGLLGPEWPGQTGSTMESKRGAGDEPRVQFTNAIGDRGVRVERSRLSFGWLGYQGERYARYEAVRDGLVALLACARSLNPDLDLVATRWGVEYRNRIPRGTVWSTVGEWDFVTLWSVAAWKNLGADPAGLRVQWQSPLERPGNSFTVEMSHHAGTGNEDGECVWLTLSAEGPVSRPESLLDGMDHGRAVIVRRFNALVSPAAKAYWSG